MCTFYSTEGFREALRQLIKKPKERYGSVVEDICDEFSGKSFREITGARVMIGEESGFRIIKTRIKNSAQDLSKKDGFRLIYLVSKEKNAVVFLFVFPKRGPQRKNNITFQEQESLIKNYKEQSTLQPCDINNRLGLDEWQP
jgi:mRNA-degrading endonuclease RelE of RelBE toxin-antitoxin system